MSHVGVTTGRTMERKACPGCNLRYSVGAPQASDTWPARLSLSPYQLDLLLLAAAEFRELCDEAGEYADCVDFLDWVRPDALSVSYVTPAETTNGNPRGTYSEKRR
jgi:hypothetical protein